MVTRSERCLVTPTTPATVDNADAPKKQYTAPRLEIYGNIHQITQAVGSDGMGDGGAHPMNKTG